MTRKKAPSMGQCCKAQALAPFIDMLENQGDDGESFVDFLEHCRIDISGVKNIETELFDCIAAHYCIRPGVYDLDRVANNLLTWPPIAARIAEIQEEQARSGKTTARQKPKRRRILS